MHVSQRKRVVLIVIVMWLNTRTGTSHVHIAQSLKICTCQCQVDIANVVAGVAKNPPKNIKAKKLLQHHFIVVTLQAIY